MNFAPLTVIELNGISFWTELSQLQYSIATLKLHWICQIDWILWHGTELNQHWIMTPIVNFVLWWMNVATLVLFIVKLWSLCCMRRSLNTVSVSRLLLTAVVLCLSCSQRIKSSCCPPQAAGSWPSAQGPSNGWEMSSSRETHDYYIKWVCLHSAFFPMQMFSCQCCLA